MGRAGSEGQWALLSELGASSRRPEPLFAPLCNGTALPLQVSLPHSAVWMGSCSRLRLPPWAPELSGNRSASKAVYLVTA